MIWSSTHTQERLMIITTTIERLISLLCLISVNTIAEQYSSPSAQRRYLTRYAPQAHLTCTRVAQRAHEQETDIYEAISISWKESYHRSQMIGGAGERGPLQAIPKYWARSHDQDYIDAGLRAWRFYRSRSGSTQEAAGRYNGAGRSSAYARKVTHHQQLLKERTRWITTP